MFIRDLQTVPAGEPRSTFFLAAVKNSEQGGMLLDHTHSATLQQRKSRWKSSMAGKYLMVLQAV